MATEGFSLEKGMKIRLLVTPRSIPWAEDARDLMSKAWHMPVWLKGGAGQGSVRLAMDTKKWTGATSARFTAGEDPVRQPYVPTAFIYRFVLGAMAAQAALGQDEVKHLFRCANDAMRGVDKRTGALEEKYRTFPILYGDLPEHMTEAAGRAQGSVGRAFQAIKRSLYFSNLSVFPRALADQARRWLAEKASCNRGLVCAGKLGEFNDFATIEDSGKGLVYTDMGSILQRASRALSGCELGDGRSSVELAKAALRFVGGAEYIQIPFLWWATYRARGVERAQHLRFLREVTAKNEEYRDLILQLSTVLLYTIKLLCEREVETPIPGTPGKRRIKTYAGLNAVLAEAFLAYRFWSAESWEQSLESLAAGADVLSELLGNEAKFALKSRDSVFGGGNLARSIVYLARKPLPAWYILPEDSNSFPHKVTRAHARAAKVLYDSGLTGGGATISHK